VSITKIETVFDGPAVILPDKETPTGERRYRAGGPHRNVASFTLRDRQNAVRLRPISARYMHGKELRSYEKNHPNV
jgi:uncharacterized DUF497 family protein